MVYQLIDVENWYIEEGKTWLSLKLISSKNWQFSNAMAQFIFAD